MKKPIFVIMLFVLSSVSQAQVNFSIEGNLCTGINLAFGPEVSVSYDVLSWNTDGNAVGQQTDLSTFFCSFGYGEHDITLYALVGEDTVAQKDSTIFINSHPMLNVSVSNFMPCEGDTIVIMSSSDQESVFTIGGTLTDSLVFPAVDGTVEYLVTATSLHGCETETTVILNAKPVPEFSPLFTIDGELIVEQTEWSGHYDLVLEGEVISTLSGNGGLLSFGEYPAGSYSCWCYFSSDCKLFLGEVVLAGILDHKKDDVIILDQTLLVTIPQEISIYSIAGQTLWSGVVKETLFLDEFPRGVLIIRHSSGIIKFIH